MRHIYLLFVAIVLSFAAKAAVNPITGTNWVCQGFTTTLNCTTPSGVWSSSNMAVGTVSTGGVVTGLAAGTTRISYTVGAEWSILTVTVRPMPVATTGPSTVCEGFTISLANLTGGGGTWSSSNPSIATVGISNGFVFGMSQGVTTITYRVTSTTCYTTKAVTVLVAPAVYELDGDLPYCAGSPCPHITLSGSETGIDYQLYCGPTVVGSVLAGTGGVLDFGAQCVGCVYSVMATNPSTTCFAPMSGSSTVHENAVPTAGFSINDDNQDLTGNAFTFTNTGSAGYPNSYAWTYGDGDGAAPTSDLFNIVNHSYTAAGTYDVTQTVTDDETGCYAQLTQTVVVTSSGVGGGGGGGLESESLGGLVSQLDFYNIKNSIDKKIDYKIATPFIKATSLSAAAKGTAGISSLERFVPGSLSNTTALINTPGKLLSITKAVDVLAVDYVKDNEAKAVTLGITTLGKAYSHTKSVCDRFRGSTLISADKVNIKGFEFIRYALLQPNGSVEYCIAFDAGKSAGRNTFALQAKWLINEYAADDSVFNFQVWAADPTHVVKLATDVLINLEAVMPVTQVDSKVEAPAAYIAIGKRAKGSLELTITNNTNATNGEIRFEERVNELANEGMLSVPVTLVKGKNNKVSIAIKDGYEYPGYLYIDGKMVDLVYMADGNWSLDYDPTYTDIAQYQTVNEPNRVYADNEYAVYRGIKVKATSGDYLNAYKFISSGNTPVDLSGYRSFKFNAEGEGAMTVTLIKGSVTKWAEQYTANVKMTAGKTNYAISFDDFVSGKAGSKAFDASDVTAVVFSMGFNGKPTEFSFKAGELAFSPEEVMSERMMSSKVVNVAPNPSAGNFSVSFASEQVREMDLQVMDVTGRVLFTQNVQAAIGMNKVSVELPASLPRPAMLMMTMGNKNVKYDPIKISVTQ